MQRNYQTLQDQVAAGLPGDGAARMQRVVDVLWQGLKDAGVSWVGFYLPDGEREMVLGPSRNKPACSPIGMHGACGQAFRTQQPLVVRDVRELGENYVACDPRDLSEVVVPVFDETGTCWGVLDLDSFDVAAFDEADVAGLRDVLLAAELTTR
jgi:putative methionine-R-sulfoxide reductase with GAF domain